MNNIGDKYLKMNNVEDVSSLIIIKIDDVYELSINQNVYECTLIQYKNGNAISYFSEN